MGTREKVARGARTQVASALLMVSCGGSTVGSQASSDETTEPRAVPEDWGRIEDCGLYFRAPPEMAEEQEQGIDSCVAVYSTPVCRYLLDVGAYSSNLGEFSAYDDFREEVRVVGGQEAKLVTAYDASDRTYYAGIHFESTGRGGAISATMTGYCSKEEDLEEALTVFESIEFAGGT